jgi:hypothetical protein
LGFLYPFLVLIAIISTANHFVLDATAGAVVYAFGWWGIAVLLNLIPVEGYFLWILRIRKPAHKVVNALEAPVGTGHQVDDAGAGLLTE